MHSSPRIHRALPALLLLAICALGLLRSAHAASSATSPTGASSLTVSGNNTFISGSITSFASGSNLTISGNLGGAPTGGTLNLANLSLSLPSTITWSPTITGNVTATGNLTLNNGQSLFLKRGSDGTPVSAIKYPTGSNNLTLTSASNVVFQDTGETAFLTVTQSAVLPNGDIVINNGKSLFMKRGSDGAEVSAVKYPSGTNNLTFTSAQDFVFQDTGETALVRISNGGNVTLGSSLSTGAPTGGGGAWKLGKVSVVTPSAATRTIAIEVDGVTLYIPARLTND